jgi:hypothetical protein
MQAKERVAGTLVIVITMLAGLIGRPTGMSIIAWMAMVGMTAYVGWSTLRRCYRLWPAAKYAWKRRLIRTLRLLRTFYRPSPGVNLIVTLSLAMMLVMVLARMVVPRSTSFQRIEMGPLVLLFVAGAMECIQRIRRLMQQTWARTVGRVAMVGLVAVIGAVAHIVAQRTAFAIHPMDPSHSPNFVILLALLLTSVLYLYAFAIFIAAWSIIEIIVLLILGLLVHAGRNSALAFMRNQCFDDLVYRLVYGRRRSREPQRQLADDSVNFVIRSVSMIVFVVCPLQLMSTMMEGREAFFTAQLKRLMVYTDYHHGPWCGLDPDGYYLPLDGKRVSVAHMDAGDTVFLTTTCPASGTGEEGGLSDTTRH